MIFRMDIKVDKNKKDDSNYIDELYKQYCANYINQIKNKLDFKTELLQIDNPIKDQLKENPKIEIIRFEMEMISPFIRKDIRNINIKPKVSRAIVTKEDSMKIKAEREKG